MLKILHSSCISNIGSEKLMNWSKHKTAFLIDSFHGARTGCVQAAKKNPTLLSSYDTTQPPKWIVWHNNPKNAVTVMYNWVNQLQSGL